MNAFKIFVAVLITAVMFPAMVVGFFWDMMSTGFVVGRSFAADLSLKWIGPIKLDENGRLVATGGKKS